MFTLKQKQEARFTFLKSEKSLDRSNAKCFICGSGGCEAHHSDYSKPLDVIWLCYFCHHALHKSVKKGITQNEVMTGTPNHKLCGNCIAKWCEKKI